MTASSSNSKSSPTTPSRAPAARWTRRSNHRRRARIGLRVHGRGGRVGRAPLRRALPMTGVRLMAGRDVKTTRGADSQMTPVAIHRGMARDSFAVVAVTPGATRSVGTHQARRPGRERPPSETPWCGRRAGCVFTQPWPQAGSLPIHGSLAGRQVTRIGSTPSVSLGAASTAAIRHTSRAPFPGRQPPLIGTPRFDPHLLFTARRRRALRQRPWPLGL